MITVKLFTCTWLYFVLNYLYLSRITLEIPQLWLLQIITNEFYNRHLLFRQAGEQLKQDVNTTAQDATHSYNTALQQLGEAFHTAEVSGKQIAQQMGVARDQAAVGVQDATTAARQQAQQKSIDAQLHAQGGKSALQQGTLLLESPLDTSLRMLL